MAGMAGQRFEAKRERTKAEAEQLCFHGLFWLGLAGLAPRRQLLARELISCMLHQAGCRARRGQRSTARRSGCMRPPTGVVGLGCTPGCQTRRQADLLRQWSLWGGGRDRGSSGVLVGCNTCNGAGGQRHSLPFPHAPLVTGCVLSAHTMHTPAPSPVAVTLPGSCRNSMAWKSGMTGLVTSPDNDGSPGWSGTMRESPARNTTGGFSGRTSPAASRHPFPFPFRGCTQRQHSRAMPQTMGVDQGVIEPSAVLGEPARCCLLLIRTGIRTWTHQARSTE